MRFTGEQVGTVRGWLAAYCVTRGRWVVQTVSVPVNFSWLWPSRASSAKNATRRGARLGRRAERIGLLPAVSWSLVGGVVIAFTAYGFLSWITPTNETAAAPIDVTRVSLTVVAGVGGVVALVIAYRRQRDIEQSRFVERFGAAAAQLGATDVAVRIAGVYAMAGVADESDGLRRQQCIDVLCGYLRLSYSPELGGNHQSKLIVKKQRTSSGSVDEEEKHFEYRQNDREVRNTIIRVIASRLHPEAEHSWSANDFDFRTAHLEEVDFSSIILSGNALFDFVTFAGYANFEKATFGRAVNFGNATFENGAGFDAVVFAGSVKFDEATFMQAASFNKAVFSEAARFYNATFTQYAWFVQAVFKDDAGFSDAAFVGGGARFRRAEFAGYAYFDSARFLSAAEFNEVKFKGLAEFEGASFKEKATFSRVAFGGGATFNRAIFDDRTSFGKASFSSHVDFEDVGFSGPATFVGVDFGSGEVHFDGPRQWGPPAPRFDWADDGNGKPPNVEPQTWPPVPNP